MKLKEGTQQKIAGKNNIEVIFTDKPPKYNLIVTSEYNENEKVNYRFKLNNKPSKKFMIKYGFKKRVQLIQL